MAQGVGYWQLVRQNSNFRRLWAAQLISAAGDWFRNVAVVGLTLDLSGGNGFAAGMVLLINNLPMFFLTPIAGPVADRFNRKWVMIAANVVGAFFALLLLLARTPDTLWILFVGCGLLVSAATFFGPAFSAAMPNLVSKEELGAANTLTSASWGIMVTLGSGIGGIVSSVMGRDATFVLNAAFFLIAAALIWSVNGTFSAKPASKPTSARGGLLAGFDDFAVGFTYLRRHSAIAGLVAVKAAWGMAAGVLVLLSIYGNEIFKQGDAGTGLLYAGRGLGALIGPFLVRAIFGSSDVKRLRWIITVSFFVSAIGYFFFGIAGSIGIAALSLVLAHIGGGANWAFSSLLLQYAVPDELRGRIFAVDFGLSTLTTGLSTLVVSLLLPPAGNVPPQTIVMFAVVAFIIAGIMWGLATAPRHMHLTDTTPAPAEG